MINIFVLEDDSIIRKSLVKQIGEKQGFTAFSSSSLLEAEDLLSSGMIFGAFFLDINLKDNTDSEDKSGYLLAKKLREDKKYIFTPIIFITSIVNMEMATYRDTHCYQYLKKPFGAEELNDILDRIFVGTEVRKMPLPRKWVVKKDGVFYPLDVDSILYVESGFRCVRVHMIDETFDVNYQTLDRALDELHKFGFMQSHKSMIVNVNFIEFIDSTNRFTKLKGVEKSLDIGKTFMKPLKECYHERDTE